VKGHLGFGRALSFPSLTTHCVPPPRQILPTPNSFQFLPQNLKESAPPCHRTDEPPNGRLVELESPSSAHGSIYPLKLTNAVIVEHSPETLPRSPRCFLSCTVIKRRRGGATQDVNPLATARAALPLPWSARLELFPAAATGPRFCFADGYLVFSQQCVTCSLKMRHFRYPEAPVESNSSVVSHDQSRPALVAAAIAGFLGRRRSIPTVPHSVEPRFAQSAK
jgi:hypothetical protein